MGGAESTDRGFAGAQDAKRTTSVAFVTARMTHSITVVNRRRSTLATVYRTGIADGNPKSPQPSGLPTYDADVRPAVVTTVVVTTALLACKQRDDEPPPPTPVTASPPATATQVPPPVNPPAPEPPAPNTAPVERTETTPDDSADRRRWKVGPGEWGWSNRCFELGKAGKYKDGAKVCDLGLKYASSDSIRGALYYNHGYISEAQGHWASARLFYRKSLKVRPGNKTTQKALTRVTGR